VNGFWMNRYILIRRLRGPAILVLFGVLAWLDVVGVIENFWSMFWPLLLILIGVMMLAERAALAMDEQLMEMPYAGGNYPGAGTGAAQPPTASDPGTAIVPAGPQEPGNIEGNGGNGGQL
jgi:hypothetical protein